MKRAGSQNSKQKNKKAKTVAFNNNVEVKVITPLKAKNKKKLKKQTKNPKLGIFLGNNDDEILAEMEKTVSMKELANDGLDVFWKDASDGESDDEFEEDLPPILSDEESEEDLHESFDESGEDEKYSENEEDKKCDITSDADSNLVAGSCSKENREVPKQEVKPVGKYLPPALRKKMGIEASLVQTKDRSKEVQNSSAPEKFAAPKIFTESNTQEDIKLKHTINGHLNKLSFDNLHKIFKLIKKLAEERSRGTVNDIIVSLLMSRLDCNDPVPDRYNSDCAIFISVLTTHHGMTLFATFIENLAHKFNDICNSLFSDTPNIDALSGKSLNNVVNMFCSLYELKSICKVLMYDVLNYFVESSLTEKKVEIILLILQKVIIVSTP